MDTTDYNYLTLLNVISNNSNSQDKKFIDDNKDTIIQNLKKLSEYMNDIIRNFSENKITKDFVKSLQKKYKNIFSNKEINNIIDTLQLKKLKGGEQQKVDEIKNKIDDKTHKFGE